MIKAVNAFFKILWQLMCALRHFHVCKQNNFSKRYKMKQEILRKLHISIEAAIRKALLLELSIKSAKRNGHYPTRNLFNRSRPLIL